MGIKWAAIKEWAGLPTEQRQWAAAAIIIISLAIAIRFIYLSDKSDDKDCKKQIQELNAEMLRVKHDCDSVNAAVREDGRQRERVLLDGTITEYRTTIEEYKKRQAAMEQGYDKIMREGRRAISTQKRTHSTLRSTIQQVQKLSNEK